MCRACESRTGASATALATGDGGAEHDATTIVSHGRRGHPRSRFRAMNPPARRHGGMSNEK
ncbi:storekeeper protein [Burkholderia pseudomallei]|nr:storekeeper protein [Burkholderia pseudomallei]RIV63473.1 storekeeper protein [Burkholderia pseudomallei]